MLYVVDTDSTWIDGKGISPGAAFVFLFAGPATNAASLSVLSKSLGKKTVAVYLAVTAVSAIGFGLLLDGLIGWLNLPMPEFSVQTHVHGVSALKIVTGVIFGVILLRSLVVKVLQKIKAVRGRNNEEAEIVDIEGMSCEHCAKAVRESIEKIDGVKSVSVDVKEGKAYIEGENIDMQAVKDVVVKAGYTPK